MALGGRAEVSEVNRSDIRCVVIVAEAVIEERLLARLDGCGATGWTVCPARGHGPADRRMSEIEGGNVRIEVLAAVDTADRIWQMLESEFFASYSVTAWEYLAAVARSDRYAPGRRPGGA